MEKQKRKIALITLIVMLLNFILPYSFMRPAQAATGNLEEKPIVFKKVGYDSSTGVMTLQWATDSEEVLDGLDFHFKIRSEIGTPCQNSGATGTTFAKVCKKAVDFDEIEYTSQKATYTAANQEFRFTGTYTAGGVEQGGYQEMYNIFVKLAAGVDPDTITLDDIVELLPVTGSLPTGIKISYRNASGGRASRDIDALGSEGFPVATKNIDTIAVTTLPTKTTYNHGDTVSRADFAGGILTITYDDSTSETVPLDDINVRLNGSTPADVANPVVNIDYKGKSTSYNITVNDPVDGLVVTNPMATTEYSTGTALDFTGLTFNAVKRSGATIPLTQTSTGLATSETVADVASPNFTMASGLTGPEKKGTQVITFTYESNTATQTITVNDHVASIEVTTQPTKKLYKRGESFNPAGAVVTVTLESGGTSTINLPDGSISLSSYSPTTTGSVQNIVATMTVGANTFTAPTTIDVEAYNYITAHTFTAPTKDTYKWGDTFSTTGGRFQFTWHGSSGTPVQAQLNSADVSITGFSPTTIGTQLITATYNAKYPLSDGTFVNDTITETFYVEVENPAKTITITAPTDAVTFTHGDSLTFGNGKIDVEYTDGTHSFPAITLAMVTETATGGAVNMSPSASDYSAATQTVTKQLKISYSQDGKSASKTYNITINNPINSIAIDTAPQSSFNVNEYETSLTPGGTIVATRKAGNTDAPVTITDSMVTGLNTLTSGSRTATVSYTDPMFSTVTKTTTYPYSVVDGTISIAVSGTPTVSQYGKPLNLSSATLTATKGSGPVSIPLPSPSVTVSGFSSTTLGTQTVTLTYDGKTTTFNVTVQDYVDKMELVPDTVSGVLGTSLSSLISSNNLKYQIKYASKSAPETPVALVDSMVAGYNANTATQSLTVTYVDSDPNSFTNGKSFTDTLNVALSNNVQTINFTKGPDKVEYKYGETLDFTGSVIDLIYENGDPGSGGISNITAKETDGSPVNMSPAASDFGTNQRYTKTVTLTYTDPTTGLTDSIPYQFDIINDVQSIAMHVAPKNTYYIGDSIDTTIGDGVTKGQILVTRAVGTPEVIDIDDPNVAITGFNTTAVGVNIPVSVKYTENGIDKLTSYNINVDDIVTFVEFENAPVKTEYQYGEPVDLSGLIIKLTYASGRIDYGSISDVVVTDGTNPVNMSPASTEFDAAHQVSKNVTLSYTDAISTLTITKPYSFKIFDTVQSISIHTPPTKLIYNVGDTLDLTGGEIKVFRASDPTNGEVMDMATNTTVTGFDSTSEHATLPLTVEYTENSTTVSDSFNVSVVDSVVSVTVNNPPTESKVGEPLDLSATTISVVKGSGPLPNKPATDGTITGYDPTTVGNQTVTISYGGESDTFVVNVKDYVTGITVNPSSVSASLGDTVADIISDNSMTYTVTYKSAGPQTAEPLVASMVSTLSTMPTQTLTVSYVDSDANSATNGDTFTDTFTVTLANNLTDVEITGAGTKTEYFYGDTIDLTGFGVKLTYADGTTPAGNVSDIVVTELDGSPLDMTPAASDFDANHKLTKTVKLTYTSGTLSDDETYTFDIIDKVTSVAVHTPPTKLNYNVSDTLDLTGGEIKVFRASDPTTGEVMDMASNATVTGFDSTTEHATLPLTVEYTENGVTESDTFNVSVIDSVSSVTINNPPTEGKVGEPLDLSATTITVVKGSGPLPDKPATDGTITGYDPNTVGNQTVTITYGGESDTFVINVKDYVTGITVNPSSVSATLGDTVADIISDNSMTYTVTYKSAGPQTAKPIVASMVSALSTNPTQTLTVSYVDSDVDSATNGDTFTDTFTVTLANSVTNVDINGTATKTTYKHGETFSLDGLSVDLTFADGTTGAGNVSDITVTEADGSPLVMNPPATEFGANTVITKAVKLRYEDAASGEYDEITYNIDIVNDVRSIDMFSTPKTNYNVGDSLDVTGGEIEVTRAVGAPDIVQMSDSAVQVTGFDSTVENTSLPLTVKYTENGETVQTSYNVSVIDSVTSMVIKTLPKQDYKYQEPLDVTGGVITIVKGSGPVDVPMTASMVKELDGTLFDSEILGTRNLRVTYGGKYADYEVSVKDFVKEITINPDTVTGKYNDELATVISDNSITYTVTYAKAGAQTPVALDVAMLDVATPYDKTDVSEQTLTFKYTDTDTDSATNGDDFTADLKVTLEDDISAIVMDTTPKTNYEYGDPLDVTGGTIKVTKLSGDHIVNIEPSMVTEMDGTPFDPTNMSTRNLKVTYEGETTTYEITIEDAVDGYNFHAPSKIVYNYGESLDISDGYIEKIMRSGASASHVPLTDASVSVSGYNANTVGSQTVTVTYGDNTFTYGVTVNDAVVSIAITTPPTKTNYDYGDSLDVTGGEIKVTYGGGRVETVSITPSMVTGYDPTTLGNQTLTVTYAGLTDTFNVNVQDYVDHIEIELPDKLTYGIGESFDPTGGTVKAVMASGTATTPVALSSATITGFDSTTEGAKTITVTYQGKSDTFGITVSDETTGWTVKTVPNKLTYRYGESLDITGATLEITKESGATEIVTVTSGMVSGYNPNRLGNQTITVTYDGETKDLAIVTVEDYIKKLNVKAPTKTKYHYGEDIDLAGGTVSIVMASGAIDETTDLTASMISGYDPTSVGTQTIPVEYKGLTGSFSVNVVDEIKGVSINTEPNKKNYVQGEDLDVSGGTLTVVKDSGIYTVPMTRDMASGYNSNTIGQQVVTVTYGGKTVTYVVNVEKKPEEEKTQTTPKTPSKPGKSGGTKVIYVSTPQPAPIPAPTPAPEQTPTPAPEPKQEEKKEQPKETKKTDKPIKTLGVKDEKEDTKDKGDWRKPVIGAIIVVAILLLLLLLLLKRNVKIYVQEDKSKDEFVLGGLDKLKKKNPKLDVDKFLDEDTYPNKVKIVLNDSISEKLDGKEIEIKHRGQTIKHKVKYEDKPYTFFLF